MKTRGSVRKPGRQGSESPKAFLPTGGQEIWLFGGGSGALLRDNDFIRYPVGKLSRVARSWSPGLCNLEPTSPLTSPLIERHITPIKYKATESLEKTMPA
jgi:hypothetical protein